MNRVTSKPGGRSECAGVHEGFWVSEYGESIVG